MEANLNRLQLIRACRELYHEARRDVEDAAATLQMTLDAEDHDDAIEKLKFHEGVIEGIERVAQMLFGVTGLDEIKRDQLSSASAGSDEERR